MLLALCFPPAGLWFLAWVALVPWLVGVRIGSNWSAAIGSWVGGFIFFGILLYWLVLFGVSVWAMAALLLGVWLMVWGVCTRLGGRLGPGLRVVGAAVLWCGVEWGRGLGQFGFTWGWLGYSQSPVLGLMPVVRAAGTLALSFLIALVNSALAEAVVGRLRGEAGLGHAARGAAACGVVVLSLVGAKSWVGRQGEPAGPVVRVAVIQGSAHGPLRAEQVNVPLTPEERRRTLEIYGSLTREAAGVRPMLVVWPESVLPGVPEEEPRVSGRVAEAARNSGAWVLAGGPYRDEQGRPRNSAYLYAPSGHQRDRYDKVQLVPFGEYVPGRGWLPLLGHYHVRDEDFAAGLQHRALQAGMMAVGPMICFESIFPRISWQLARQGAQVLVIITNDAWFGRTAAAAQHRQIAVLRAVETNRWVVRGASTGISSIIAPDGRVVAEAGLFEREWISADIRLASERSRAEVREAGMGWGPILSWAVFCLAIGFIVVSAVGPGGRQGRAARPPGGRRRRGRATPR
ncbi:MAG: apolipoprotein N-acyltransferase [Armatimonadota bacterium]|nr:MAG: apolipoprotein N-acyltransferase [Armatimonadota bacterium]